MNSDSVKRELGAIAAGLFSKLYGGVFPALRPELRSNDLLSRLKNGDFSVDEELIAHFTGLAQNYLINPFSANVREVTRQLVGSTIIRVTSPGNVEAALITAAMGYEDNDYPLGFADSGTWGVWTSPRLGGYQVACIAAHSLGQHGYIGIHSATTSAATLSMSQFTKTFSHPEFEGKSIITTHSPIKIMLRDSNTPDITEDLKVYTNEKKGKGCVASYIVASKKRA